MARAKTQEGRGRRGKPATSPDQREQQLISAAHDLVEERIRTGTASSQEVTHFLKLGSSRERLEQERMEHEIELSKVKAQQIRDQKRSDELFAEALEAMRSYSGSALPNGGDDVED